jgi:hypothetical protein
LPLALAKLIALEDQALMEEIKLKKRLAFGHLAALLPLWRRIYNLWVDESGNLCDQSVQNLEQDAAILGSG